MAGPDASAGTGAWELLLRVHATLVHDLGREVEATTGLPLSWYDVLLELNRARGRLRMTELSERVVLSRSRVSRLVDHMAVEGLVDKVADPEDGRATFATVTAKGRAALRRAAPVYLEGIDRLFSSRLTAREIDGIAAAFGKILESGGSDRRGG